MAIKHWALSALLVVSAAAQSQPYNFSVVADLTGWGAFTAPALTDSGTVLQGLGNPNAQRLELFHRGSAGVTLLDTSGALASFANITPFPLNNAGTVAIRGTLDSGAEGIFTYGAQGLKTIADNTGQFSGFGAPPSLPALNESGEVAFYGQLRSGASGVFLGNGSTITTLASTASAPYNGFLPVAVALNDRRDVAMVGNLAGSGQQLLLSRGGAPATPIIDTTGPIASFGSLMHMNNSGSIAFVGNLDAGGSTLFVWSAGQLTPIMSALPGGGLFNPSINDRGAISFYWNQGGSGHVMYLYRPETGVMRLVGAGDSFLSSTVTETGRGLFSSVNSLNNLDELAFHLFLDDGRQLLVLASPVPEPKLHALLLVGLLVLAARERLNRRMLG